MRKETKILLIFDVASRISDSVWLFTFQYQGPRLWRFSSWTHAAMKTFHADGWKSRFLMNSICWAKQRRCFFADTYRHLSYNWCQKKTYSRSLCIKEHYLQSSYYTISMIVLLWLLPPWLRWPRAPLNVLPFRSSTIIMEATSRSWLPHSDSSQKWTQFR